MAEIKVTTLILARKASELDHLNNAFKKEVESMAIFEGSLMGMWEGDAKTAFHTAFNNGKTQMWNL